MKNSLGERKLTAIVFTDVAGFSSKAAADEEKTLRRVREDLELLISLSEKNGGKIIKTTGDGLLISFGSAVDAVSFAVKGQRKISAQNQKLPSGDRLEHRMGIHLGDIFLTESDAMGDGVNIAARLQSEAQPGGICISQTVYDVVKNKLAIKVVSIGPRELKNIREAICVYRIVVDAESSLAREAMPKAAASAINRKAVLYSIIAAVVLIGIIATVIIASRSRDAGPVPLGTGATAESPLPQDLRATTIEWVRPRLAHHGRQNPLHLKPSRRLSVRGGASKLPPMAIWMEEDEVIIDVRGDIRRRRLEQLNPRILAEIAKELSRETGGEKGLPSRPLRLPPLAE